MRRIAIIANMALATRLFLRTPVFALLQKNPNNFITVYTPARRLASEFRFRNVKIRSFKYLWGIEKSDVILLADWIDPLLINVLKIAENKKIPTLFVQEGAGNPSGGYAVDIYPTKLAVWGNVAKQIYTRRGIDPQRIVVTGQPRFDWYHNFQSQKIFSDSKKVLLFTTQALTHKHLPNSREVIMRQFEIMYQASKRLNLQLVCKLHPSDKPDPYKREGVIVLEETACRSENYLKWYCNTCYDPKISDIKTLAQILLSSDVVTTIYSTTALEAMILGRPAIFFDTAGFYKSAEIFKTLIEKSRFAAAKDEQEFVGLLEKYLKDPSLDRQKREEVVFDFAYKQDGKASERVVGVMEELLS